MCNQGKQIPTDMTQTCLQHPKAGVSLTKFEANPLKLEAKPFFPILSDGCYSFWCGRKVLVSLACVFRALL